MNTKRSFSKILFLCVANSARSQMAEALAKNILPNTIDIRSAGSRPAPNVHPIAIQTLTEFTSEILKAYPKKIESLPAYFLDQNCLIIRLCSEEECPLVTSASEVRDWSLSDPANPENGDAISAFTETKKVLVEKLYALKKEFN